MKKFVILALLLSFALGLNAGVTKSAYITLSGGKPQMRAAAPGSQSVQISANVKIAGLNLDSLLAIAKAPLTLSFQNGTTLTLNPTGVGAASVSLNVGGIILSGSYANQAIDVSINNVAWNSGSITDGSGSVGVLTLS